VGYYGGLNYGHGYTGTGYQGGRWDHVVFFYNRAASNARVQVVHNRLYNSRLVNYASRGQVSFNGGPAGSSARPSLTERHLQATEHAAPRDEQLRHEHQALTTPTQRANGPHGQPQVAATPRPSEYSAAGVQALRRHAVPRSRRRATSNLKRRTDRRASRRNSRSHNSRHNSRHNGPSTISTTSPRAALSLGARRVSAKSTEAKAGVVLARSRRVGATGDNLAAVSGHVGQHGGRPHTLAAEHGRPVAGGLVVVSANDCRVEA